MLKMNKKLLSTLLLLLTIPSLTLQMSLLQGSPIIGIDAEKSASITILDMVGKAPKAIWQTGVLQKWKQIRFGGPDTDPNGFAMYKYNIKLNDGKTYSRILETHPMWKDYGWILGSYRNIYLPKGGAAFHAKVGFIQGGEAGDVRLQFYLWNEERQRIEYIALNTLLSYRDGVKTYKVTIPERYLGSSWTLRIKVDAQGRSGPSSGQDWVAWANAYATGRYVLNMDLSSTRIELTQGESEELTVHLTGDYPKDVTLSVSGLPAGVSASFTVPSHRVPFTSKLRLIAAEDAKTGTFTVHIRAKRGSEISIVRSFTLIMKPKSRPDFTIDASPPSTTIGRGEEASYSIVINPLEGFNQPVSLSINGLPAGTIHEFNPLSGTPPFTSILKVRTSNVTPLGVHRITITASGGGKTHSKSVDLIVKAMPDFSIGVDPKSVTIEQGEAAEYVIGVAPMEGFSSEVSLSVSGLPNGATASFSHTSGVPPLKSIMRIETLETTPVGSYTITVTGIGGGKSHSDSVNLIVEERALPDLVIEQILCDRENRRIGYVVKNAGGAKVSAGHRAVLMVKGEMVDEDEVDVDLNPGEIYEGYFENYEWTDSVVITLCADYYDVVVEADEDNNCRRSECVVREVPISPPAEELPDLMVDPYSTVSYNPDAREFYYTILNAGDASAPSTVTEVYIDGVRVAERRVGPLNAHDKRREVIPYDWSDCPICTEHTVEFRLDARDEVEELWEGNNNKFKSIKCSILFLPDIDLVVEDIRFDATSHRIGFTLSNRGSGMSPETEARLWIDNHLVDSLHISPLAGGRSRVEYFDHRWWCEGYEDNIKVWVEPVLRLVEDCSGVEVGLGELSYTNNWAEVTWDCPWPDLVMERASFGSIGETTGIIYTITNQGRSRAGPSITKLYCSSTGSAVASDEVPALEPGESWEGIFPGIAADYCALPSEGWASIYVKADGDDAVTELNEVNNMRPIHVFCGYELTPGKADLSVDRIWFERTSTTPCSTPCRVCFEIKNVGALSVEEFIGDRLHKDTTETEVEIFCGCYSGIYELRTEPDLAPRESRVVCYDLSTFGDWCGCEKIFVNVEVDNSWDLASFGSPKDNDRKSAELENRCANGIQDQGEEGIDCGGPCPARCRDCFADADYGSAENSGYFRLDSMFVHYYAQLALEEYANCLRSGPCRSTLESYDPSIDFLTVTVEDLEASTDYIMEAVASYVANHTRYMYDDHDEVLNAEEMLLYSRYRGGKLDDGTHVDTCPTLFCGDCEDQAILREALMRVLGVSWRCAYCADHYDGYWGDGHTFNLVYYRSKWRIMDYHSLGHYFGIERYWDEHDPHNAWNDHVGEYWCPDWISDPACWFCCNHDPPQNYDGGETCDSYYRECAP